MVDDFLWQWWDGWLFGVIFLGCVEFRMVVGVDVVVLDEFFGQLYDFFVGVGLCVLLVVFV